MSPATERMRSHLRYYGYETQWKMGLKIMAVCTSVLLVGAIFAMIDNWTNLEIRFQTFESANELVLILIMFLENTVMPGNINKLLTLIEEEFFKYHSYESPKRKKFLQQESASEMSILRKVELMLIIGDCSLWMLPVILIARSVVMAGSFSVLDTRTMPLPIEMLSTTGKSSAPLYLITFAMQIIFYLNCLKIAFVIYDSGIIAIQRVTAEIEFFASIIREVGILATKEGNLCDGDIVYYPGSHLDLHAFWRELVKHHYFICRNVIQLNEGIKFIASATNQTFCITICVGLYYCMENVDLFTKFKNLGLLACVLAIIFTFSTTGQSLVNEGERMRDALADWDWVQSPLWLQKSLLLVLTRTNLPFQVKPFGIFSLDLRNFSVVIRAAYSYFNLLQSFSKK